MAVTVLWDNGASFNAFRDFNALPARSSGAVARRRSGVQRGSSKKDFDVDKNTVVADIGCAEANFSLDIVDRVKHIYLFETNNVWDQPLKSTFQKFKNKVTIVNKKFSNKDTSNTVNGVKFLNDKGVNFIKIDVDGYEDEVMTNIEEMIKKTNNMKIALCTYHAQDDYNKYSKKLRSLGFEITHSKGYMIFYWDKNLKYPYLRRGLIRAKK